jgi:2-oxoglutarate dehydrogenase E1 component
MGAWRYLEAKLRELVAEGHGMQIRYLGRPERASPAEGYPAAHAAEQTRIIQEALGTAAAQAPPQTMTGPGEGQG